MRCGLEGSIALIQLALELICWAYLEDSSPDKATLDAFDRKARRCENKDYP